MALPCTWVMAIRSLYLTCPLVCGEDGRALGFKGIEECPIDAYPVHAKTSFSAWL